MITTGCNFITTTWQGFKNFIEKNYKDLDDTKIEAVSKICFQFFKLIGCSHRDPLIINLKQRKEMSMHIFKGSQGATLSSLHQYVEAIVAQIFKKSFQINLEFSIYNPSTFCDFKLTWEENNIFIRKLPRPPSVEVQAANTMTQMYENAKQGILTDIVIKVGETKFSAHKSILACCSEFFKAMFTSKMLEVHQSEVDLSETPFITKESFEAYLEYTYVKTLPEIISKDMDQLINLLRLSDYFDYKELFDACVLNLSEKIDRTNIRRISKVAIDLRKESLRNVCKRYISEKQRALLNRRVRSKTRHSSPDLRCKSQISKTTY